MCARVSAAFGAIDNSLVARLRGPAQRRADVAGLLTVRMGSMVCVTGLRPEYCEREKLSLIGNLSFLKSADKCYQTADV